MSAQVPPTGEESPDYSPTPPPPPPPGYAPPPPPPGYTSVPGVPDPLSQSDERLWAMLAHVSGLLFAIIGPLIVLLVFGKRSAFVDDQSKEALNFQITATVASIISAVLVIVLVGLILLPVVAIGFIVLTIIGAIKAYAGEPYRYPVNVRLIK